MVGIVTYFSTMKVSNFISKKEFERNNKINVSINSRLNNIVDYKSFMELYNNSDVFFAIDEEIFKKFNSEKFNNITILKNLFTK